LRFLPVLPFLSSVQKGGASSKKLRPRGGSGRFGGSEVRRVVVRVRVGVAVGSDRAEFSGVGVETAVRRAAVVRAGRGAGSDAVESATLPLPFAAAFAGRAGFSAFAAVRTPDFAAVAGGVWRPATSV